MIIVERPEGWIRVNGTPHKTFENEYDLVDFLTQSRIDYRSGKTNTRWFRAEPSPPFIAAEYE
jgi:hypothetical protein